MYSVVEYHNSFVEVIRSKNIKKYESYAVAKNYEVKILYQNDDKIFCKSFLAAKKRKLKVLCEKYNDAFSNLPKSNLSQCINVSSLNSDTTEPLTENFECNLSFDGDIFSNINDEQLDLQCSQVLQNLENCMKPHIQEAGNEKKSQKNDSKIIIIENQIINNLNQDRSQSAIISVSDGKKKAPQKKHSCQFCDKKVYKIYRHYTEVHKDHQEIKKILALPKKSVHRRNLLDDLRKRGDYKYNTQLRNEKENIIVCRESTNTARIRNVPCPQCLGYYSKLSIRHHIEKCIPSKRKDGKRTNIQAECRRYENNIHQIASDDMKKKIFPVLNEDDITNAIRYDELVIRYGNYLCRKYTAEHHAQQIRSNLRAMGRLILAVKAIRPSMECLSDFFNPESIDLIIQGVDKVAGLDESSHLYKAPATALLLGTELKKLCKLMEVEFIKEGNTYSQKKMENLFLLFNVEFQVTINKKGVETQKIHQRRKKIKLPKTDQIARFRIYLENKIKVYSTKLETCYSSSDWTKLTEYTLVHLAIFNRKRPGETQRILIDDYRNYEIVEDEDILHDNFSEEQGKKWARVRFTGKLGKNTALLVHREIGFKAINLILKYRIKAGVHPNNRFVFGEPSHYRTQNTFQACSLIRKFAFQSGIENPELLRTRLLRQHLATETAKTCVDPHIEGRVADFMSHNKQIHEDYYVLTQKTDDITKVSKLLEELSAVKEQQNTSSCSYQSKPLRVETSKPLLGNFDISLNNSSDESENPEYGVTQSELNYIMGKKQSRISWTTTEKETARNYFNDEIHQNYDVSKQKVKKFFHLHQDLYKHRTPHLIMQWVKCQQKNISAQQDGYKGKRIRWSTPEKEIVRTSTEKHSESDTTPSLDECEQLIEDNKIILKNRNAKSVRSYIINQSRKKKLLIS